MRACQIVLFGAITSAVLAQINGSFCGSIGNPIKAANATGILASTTGPKFNFTRYMSFSREDKIAIVQDIITIHHEVPIGTDLSSPDIEGCIITFQERKAMNLKLTIKDNGTCSTVLGGACASEINRRLRNVRFADLGPEYCKQLSEAIGSSLEEKNGQCTAIGWGGLQTESISPSQQPCTQTGYLLSNHRSSAASLNPKAPEDDFSLYDEAVGIPLPLVIALWETTGTETEDISSRIMDPKVMCMGVKVLEGSRQARIALEDDEKDDGNGDDEDMDGIAGRVDGGFQMALFAGWR